MASFMPLQSAIGGLYIGISCGVYMLLAGRIAGNSGALKSVLVGSFEATKGAFLIGLAGGGAALGALMPTAFEASKTVVGRENLGGARSSYFCSFVMRSRS